MDSSLPDTFDTCGACFKAVVLKLVGGTELCKFYAGIHRTIS